MQGAFYNDFDAGAARWLRLLEADRLIEEGAVTDCDVRMLVNPPDAERSHFFAGVGGWPLALEICGWEGPAWTASLPCQPFSDAGKRSGTDDERHLWPDFRRLVERGRPPVLMGEQVASPLGRQWLADLRADLEGLGYESVAAVLPAAAVGAPHLRHRAFWLARRKGHPLRLHATNLFRRTWDDGLLLQCRDGKARRAGVPPMCEPDNGRVAALQGYGNAIVPELAALFVEAAVACEGERRWADAFDEAMRQFVEPNGSPECELRWMPDELPRVFAAARRAPYRGDLFSEASFSGWRTPSHADGRRGISADPPDVHRRIGLRENADSACWPTPKAQRPDHAGTYGRGNPNMAMVAEWATWATPTAMDGCRGAKDPRPHDAGVPLSQMAVLGTWPTPTSRDWKDTPGMALRAVNPDGSHRARTDQLARFAHWQLCVDPELKINLNPEFSRWLMGFPEGWTRT